MTGGKRRQEAKIINLAEARKRRFKTRSADPEESKEETVSREACIAILRDIVPCERKTLDPLNIPERLYPGEELNSFTSRPDEDVIDLRNALLGHGSVPDEIPDYWLEITPRGSNVFCLLADRNRKIAVSGSIKNMYAGKGTWVGFMDVLNEALDTVKAIEAEGKGVKFVVNNEGILTVKEAS